MVRKLINQLKKNQREFDHEYFINKNFKNKLDPNYAFFDCLLSCELKSNSENSLEECVDNYEIKQSLKNLDG